MSKNTVLSILLQKIRVFIFDTKIKNIKPQKITDILEIN